MRQKLIVISTLLILCLTLNAQVSGTAKVTPKKMIYVEGGTFQMGSTNGGSSEQPIHTVTVSSFLIGKYEVTQKEWQEVMGYNPSYSEGDNRPVEKVSWYDAVEFCNKLSEKEGLTPAYTINGFDVSCNWSANGYRLPTEAEWEYAAKGGKKSKNYKYSGSDNIDDVAWYDANSDGRSHDVGTKAPNELGIYDMSGNVWEMCWDSFDNSYKFHSVKKYEVLFILTKLAALAIIEI